MRVYKVKQGIVLEKDNSLFLLENQNWDAFINDDNLFEKIEKATKELKPLSQGRDDCAERNTGSYSKSGGLGQWCNLFKKQSWTAGRI